MNALSVGLPGLEKASVTLLVYRYPASELTAIVTKDPAGNASFMNYLCQRFDDIFTFQLWANSGSQALPRKSVDHG